MYSTNKGPRAPKEMVMKAIACVVGLVILLALGGSIGCINVQAPEKVEVDGRKSDGQSWEEYGKSYAEPYRSKNSGETADD
jgi:hypothetical protein